MIRIQRAPQEPSELTAVRTAELQRIRRDHPGGPTKREEIGREFVVAKDALWRQQHSKCCYCEKTYPQTGHDVEHYRPVSHYWWLAWTWENLMFSCQNCNRFAKNAKFPLFEEKTRLIAEQQPPGMEKAKLLDPTAENPREHIEFHLDSVRGQWVARPRNGSIRGGVTIMALKLNAPDYLDLRLGYIKRMILPEIERIKRAMAAKNDEEVKTRWEELTSQLLQPTMEYCALSHDALDSLIPETIRRDWGLSLSLP